MVLGWNCFNISSFLIDGFVGGHWHFIDKFLQLLVDLVLIFTSA
jgi:hypothetical protein